MGTELALAVQTRRSAGAILDEGTIQGGAVEHRPPSHEELVDLSWLLDSALVAGNRAGAIDFAARLQDSLHRRQDKRSDLGLGLRAELTALLTRLRRGDIPRRTAFRHRVQRLIDEDLQTVGS